MSCMHHVSWTAGGGRFGDTVVSFPVRVTDPALLDTEQLRQMLADHTGTEIPAPLVVVSVKPV